MRKEECVNISVFGRSGAPLKIHPDPATVTVGENVAWGLYYDGRDGQFEDPLLWTVYFSSGSPFGGWESRSIETKPGAKPEQKGMIEGGPASTEGEYKYGVRLQNGRTKQLLCDDDPRLIVRLRSR
jgi:hypothetical protein